MKKHRVVSGVLRSAGRLFHVRPSGFQCSRGSDPLQLINFGRAAHPGKGSAAGRKFLARPIQPARSVCVSSVRFFISHFLLHLGEEAKNVRRSNRRLQYRIQAANLIVKRTSIVQIFKRNTA